MTRIFSLENLQNLKRAGVVTSQRSGQRRTYALRPAALRDLAAALSRLADTADQVGGPCETYDRYGLTVHAERLAAEGPGWADGRSFTFLRSLTASPELVWRHLTDAALVAPWWTPDDLRVSELVFEARPGGRVVLEYRDAEDADGSDLVAGRAEGVIDDVRTAERLAYRLSPLLPDGSSPSPPTSTSGSEQPTTGQTSTFTTGSPTAPSTPRTSSQASRSASARASTSSRRPSPRAPPTAPTTPSETPTPGARSDREDRRPQSLTSLWEPATTALLGRVNAEGFLAFWPTVIGMEGADPRDEGFAKWLVDPDKVVLSSTLRESPWERTTVVDKATAEVVTELKATEGGDILVPNSASIIKAPLAVDLVDRLTLTILPSFLGGGPRLFDDGLPAAQWVLASQARGTTGRWPSTTEPVDPRPVAAPRQTLNPCRQPGSVHRIDWRPGLSSSSRPWAAGLLGCCPRTHVSIC